MTAIDLVTLRYTFHQLGWCKDGGLCHAFAHGDDPEDDILRERFIATYEEGRTMTLDPEGYPIPEDPT